MRNARIVAAAAVLFGLMTGAVTAPAQEGAPTEGTYDQASADELFKKAVAYLKEERFDRACPLLEESYRLDPLPGALFMLASCEAERGRLMTAIKRYDEYLDLYQSLPPERKSRQGTRERDARDKIASLLPQVAKVTLVSADLFTMVGTVTRLDGAVIPPSSIGIELPMDPGEHVATTQEPGGPVREHRFKVSPGEALEVKLYTIPTLFPLESKKEVGPRKEVPFEPSAGESNRRIAAYTIGGLGCVALIGGAVAAGLAAGDQETKTSDDQVMLQSVGGVGIGIGVAMTGIAAALFLTEPRETPARAAGKGGFQAGVSIGENGSARLQIQGRW